MSFAFIRKKLGIRDYSLQSAVSPPRCKFTFSFPQLGILLNHIVICTKFQQFQFGIKYINRQWTQLSHFSNIFSSIPTAYPALFKPIFVFHRGQIHSWFNQIITVRLDGKGGKVNTETKGTLLYHSSSYVTPPCTPSSLFPLPCLLRCFFFFSPSSSRLLLLSFPSSVSRCRDFRLSLSFSFFSLSSPSSPLSLCFRLCLLLDFSPL